MLCFSIGFAFDPRPGNGFVSSVGPWGLEFPSFYSGLCERWPTFLSTRQGGREPLQREHSLRAARYADASRRSVSRLAPERPRDARWARQQASAEKSLGQNSFAPRGLEVPQTPARGLSAKWALLYARLTRESGAPRLPLSSLFASRASLSHWAGFACEIALGAMPMAESSCTCSGRGCVNLGFVFFLLGFSASNCPYVGVGVPKRLLTSGAGLEFHAGLSFGWLLRVR